MLHRPLETTPLTTTYLRLRPESDDPVMFSLSELLAELFGRSLCGADYAVVGIW